MELSVTPPTTVACSTNAWPLLRTILERLFSSFPTDTLQTQNLESPFQTFLNDAFQQGKIYFVKYLEKYLQGICSDNIVQWHSMFSLESVFLNYLGYVDYILSSSEHFQSPVLCHS